MAKIVVTCPEARGHINGSTSLATELKARGHEVVFLGRLDGKEPVEAQEIRYVSIAEEEFPLGSTLTFFEKVGRAEGKEAFEITIQYYYDSTRMLLTYLPGAITKENPDLILNDQTYRAGAAVASKLEVPYVTICNALNFMSDPRVPPPVAPWFYWSGPLGRLRNKLGYKGYYKAIKPIIDLVDDWARTNRVPFSSSGNASNSSLLILSQLVPEFELPRDPIPQILHVGPFANDARVEVDDFPWDQVEGREFIYASLGTVQNQVVQIFQIISKVCADLGLPLVISGGGGVDLSGVAFEGQPVVVSHAPQLKILQKARMVITHAGMNTAAESLKYGVPMVAIPITNDQPGVGARIQYHRVGETIFIKRLNESRLKCAIEKVWNDPVYKNNAKKFKKLISNAGGSRVAADAIEGVLARIQNGP